MSAFDAAIALSQSELNMAVAAIYNKVYPNAFKGSQAVNQLGIDSVEWNVAQAPVFNLSPPAQQAALTAFKNNLKASGNLYNTGLNEADAHALLDNSLPTFALDLPQVVMTLVPQTGTPFPIVLTNVTAQCFISVSGSTISLNPQNVTADPLPDPTNEFFVKLVILPQLTTALQSLLSGLTIPPFQLNGISFSYPSVNIVDGYIIAAVNLAAKGAPAAPGGGNWTGAGFSMLLSQDLVQANASSLGKNFGDSGKGGSHWAGYDWSYNLSLVNPSVSITPSGGVDVGFSLSGSVAAEAYIVYIPIGIGYTASAVPTPTAHCVVNPSGGQLHIVTSSVSTFTVLVVPSGSVSEKIAGWILEAIVEAVSASVAPVISSFLGGINLASIDIPAYTENVAGTFITLTPGNLSVSNINGYLALGGSLLVS